MQNATAPNVRHTSHPCENPDCRSTCRWILVDPMHDGTPGYDGIHANATRWRVIAGKVSRSFGAVTFDTEADAVDYRDGMVEIARKAEEPPVGGAELARSIPIPWGTVHQPA